MVNDEYLRQQNQSRETPLIDGVVTNLGNGFFEYEITVDAKSLSDGYYLIKDIYKINFSSVTSIRMMRDSNINENRPGFFIIDVLSNEDLKTRFSFTTAEAAIKSYNDLKKWWLEAIAMKKESQLYSLKRF